jgi:hypothetical protein
MTHYELQVAHNKKHADRTIVLLQTKHLIMFEVDKKIVYVNEYDDNGKCIGHNCRKVTK